MNQRRRAKRNAKILITFCVFWLALTLVWLVTALLRNDPTASPYGMYDDVDLTPYGEVYEDDPTEKELMLKEMGQRANRALGLVPVDDDGLLTEPEGNIAIDPHEE